MVVEAACAYPAYRETLPGGPSYTVLDQLPAGGADDRAPVKVPADHVFLMTIATTASTAAIRPRSAASASCPSTI